MAKPNVVPEEQVLTLEDRRAFLRLPLEERRRQLTDQADRMSRYYSANRETSDRQEWQGGEIVEC